MTERYTRDIILCRLDGTRERIPRKQEWEALEASSFTTSFMLDNSQFDYIGTQDGDRIYQERKQND